MSKLSDSCEKLYVVGGQYAVYDYIKKHHPSIPWEDCQACETNSPAENHECLVCGSPTLKSSYKGEEEW